jgi:phage replication-related protein YjqB (UPF0714/DUF867 family)
MVRNCLKTLEMVFFDFLRDHQNSILHFFGYRFIESEVCMQLTQVHEKMVFLDQISVL